VISPANYFNLGGGKYLALDLPEPLVKGGSKIVLTV